jgi:hypothetical protein
VDSCTLFQRFLSYIILLGIIYLMRIIKALKLIEYYLPPETWPIIAGVYP